MPSEVRPTPRLPNRTGSGAFLFMVFSRSVCAPLRPFRGELDRRENERAAPGDDVDGGIEAVSTEALSARPPVSSVCSSRTSTADVSDVLDAPGTFDFLKKTDGDASVRSTPVVSETRWGRFRYLSAFSTFADFRHSQRSATIGITRGRFAASRFAKDRM